jgi:ABC-type ATPase involved in cell division
VLLADEPTGELHTDDKARVLELFESLNAEGRTVIIETHDPVSRRAVPFSRWRRLPLSVRASSPASIARASGRGSGH